MIIGIELGGWDIDAKPESQFTSLANMAETAASSGFRLLAMPAQTWVGRSPTLQPLETVSALAERCEATLLTGPLLVAVGHPVDIGEQIATAQHAADGRLIVEVQTAAEPADLAAFQIDPTQVGPRTRESIAVWRRIWFEDFVDHAGTFYKVPGAQPTLRLHDGNAPAIALSVHARADLEMARALAAGLSMTSESTHHAPERIAAISTARARRLPVIMRTPIDTPAALDEQIAVHAAAGVDHLVLQPRAPTLPDIARLVRECGEIVSESP